MNRQALQLAAQAWCTPATSGLEMDVNLATAVAEKFAPIIAENAALKAELERERMRLVACGVVALADTPESAATARKMHPDYESASCADVAWRVDECIRLRAELEAIQQGAGEPVAFMVRRDDWPEGVTQPVKGSEPPIWADIAAPLYTRPATPLTEEQIEAGREAVFSTNNPFCPCDSKTMRKAVRWAEAAHNIKGAKP